MEKLPTRKRTTSTNSNITRMTLPPPPPLPRSQLNSNPISPLHINIPSEESLPDSIQYLCDYKTREEQFLKNLKETITNDSNIILKKEKELYTLATQASISDLVGENSFISATPKHCNLLKDNLNNSSTFNIVSHSVISDPTSNKTVSRDDVRTKMDITASSDISQEISSTNSSFLTSKILDQEIPQYSESDVLKQECEKFIKPLLNRTNSCISAALAAYDAFEQLSSLHGLIDKIMKLEDQNYQTMKYIRDVKMLCELNKLQTKNYSNDLFNEAEDLHSNELDLNDHSGLLKTILVAGNTASSKRNFSKRHNRERSKSVFCGETLRENIEATSTPRRQSAYATNLNKVKVSKWTKVKAAFKWEKANVQSSEELLKSNINQLKPINNEVARYLRVPAPIPITGSSVDSILSVSVPPTPANVSSASSMEDVRQVSDERRDSSKSDSRFETQSNNVEEEKRRSRSFDSDMMVSQISSPAIKCKTPWTKVKNMIQTHSGSFKNTRSRSIKSTNSAGKDSRDVSPSELNIENLQLLLNDSQEYTSHKQNFQNILSPSSSSTTANSLKGNSSGPNSPGILSGLSLMNFIGEDEKSIEIKPKILTTKPMRKNRIVSGFESLPEGTPVDVISSGTNQAAPSPLILNSKVVASEAELSDVSYFPNIGQKNSIKTFSHRKHLTSAGNSSVPSSPSRHSEFFQEFESEDMSSGDFSEPTTPSRKLSNRLYYKLQQDEINERYLELREKLNKEFEAKRQEWEKMRFSGSSSSSSAYQLIQSNDLLQTNKNIPPKFLEENLSADFKKKLHKWRNKKSESTAVATNDNLTSLKGEKIDWNLWKTGQLKLEGQGLSPLPDQKSLPEEFQKKLDQWKKIKDANTSSSGCTYTQSSLRRSSGKFAIAVRSHETTKKTKDDVKLEKFNKSYEKEKSEKLSKLRAIVTEPKAKEIEVQTSVGVMKFEGISRKFTRKLYEWEKAKGIGPESSTFAFLYPGYRSVTTGNKSAERRSNESSPNLGRSFSLDSISPIQSVPSVSHQTSCLSLNDVNELRVDERVTGQTRRISSSIELCPNNCIEDNMQEFVDPIGEPSSEQRLFNQDDHFLKDTATKLNNKTISHNFTLSPLEKAVEILKLFGNKTPDNLQNALRALHELEDSIQDFEDGLGRLNNEGKEAMVRVRKNVAELITQCHELNQDEACCQELLDERTAAIEEIFHSLKQNILLGCKCAQITPSEPSIPKINVTSDNEGKMICPWRIANMSSKIISKTGRCNELDSKVSEHETVNVGTKTATELTFDSKSKICRNSSNGSRKKSRLRKMGSRQNSKTESESTDDEAVKSNEVTQRRLKRRLSRNKKSIEEDKLELNINEERAISINTAHSNNNFPTPGVEDVVYVLKIKPGQPIEQSEVYCNYSGETSKILISPTETSVQLLNNTSQKNAELDQQNIFVETKRKIFTLVGTQTSETGSDSGIGPLAISKDLDSSTTTEVPETEDSCRDSISLNSFSKPCRKKLEPLILDFSENSIYFQNPPKESLPSSKLIIDKYNQKLELQKIAKSPLSSGTCTPSSIQSPVLERRIVQEQTDINKKTIENIIKFASYRSISDQNLTKIETSLKIDDKENRISKSFSLENIPEKILGDIYLSDIRPLAYDSLKNIRKSLEAFQNSKSELKEKNHLFKKNKEKPSNLNVSKGGALKKIDLKHKVEHTKRRNSFTSENGDIVLEKLRSFPNKSDNTIPKITRKLENKATTPTEKSHPLSAELWHPLLPISNKNYFDEAECPKTPINERAKKLAHAKEQFLREIPTRSSSFKETFDTSDPMWNISPRISQTSCESEISNDNGAWQNCNNVEMIKTISNSTLEIAQNGSGYDDSEKYVSLPRSIARSEKITSKLGFATLASKFRKKRRGSGSEVTPKMSAVSVLCQQSLVLGVAQVSKDVKAKKEAVDSLKKINKNYTVIKSKSSHVGSFGTLFRSKDKNKSRKNDQTEDGNSTKSVLKSKSAVLLPISNNK